MAEPFNNDPMFGDVGQRYITVRLRVSQAVALSVAAGEFAVIVGDPDLDAGIAALETAMAEDGRKFREEESMAADHGPLDYERTKKASDPGPVPRRDIHVRRWV